MLRPNETHDSMSLSGTGIWRLHTKSNKYFSLIPHDLNYFRDHFNGSRMRDEWSAPPITIAGKSKKMADFVGWMICAPVMSERARAALEPILGTCVRFSHFTNCADEDTLQ